MSVHVPVRLFADGKSVTVLVMVRVMIDGLWWVFFCLVVYFGGSAEALLPMMRPIVVLHRHFLGSFGISAHSHAVDQAAHESQEAEYQEYDTQYPVEYI